MSKKPTNKNKGAVKSKVKSSKGTFKFTRADELKQLESLLELMKEHKIADLEWSSGEEKIRLRTTQAPVSYEHVPAMVHTAPVHVAAAPAKSAPKAEAGRPAAQPEPAVNDKIKKIKSPLVGTFYRAPSPSAEPYVKPGKTVKKGDVLCIVEAMKLMNEIESEFNGKIVSVLIENGQPVEFGEALFEIEAE